MDPAGCEYDGVELLVEDGGVLLGVDEGEVVLDGVEVLFGFVSVVLDGLVLEGCWVVVSVLDGFDEVAGDVVLDGDVLDGVVWLC